MTIANTPYDDVFRTLLNDCTNLIIPVLNEVFGENYSGREKIVFYPNEHFMNRQDGQQTERITDTCFAIQGNVIKKFHWECQNSKDTSMLVRTFEYDTQIALDEGEIEENVLAVKFPYSAILYLRADKSVPDTLKIRMETSEGNLTYHVLTMKVQKYTLHEIFDKNLLFIIPFYIFLHESKFAEYNQDKEKRKKLIREYEYIRNQLECLCDKRVIDEYVKCTIIDMSNKVLEHIAAKYDKVKEGVKSVMCGKVLEYEAKTIRNEGITQGKLETYLELVRDGLVAIEVAAQRLHRSVEEIERLL